MKYRLLNIAWMLMVALIAVSQSLSRERAIEVASSFMAEKWHSGVKSKRYSNPTLSANMLGTSSAMVVDEERGDFALVCGVDSLAMVIGYGNCAKGALPEQLMSMARVKPLALNTTGTNLLWAMQDGYSLPISPLLGSVRHQSEPFNGQCPYYMYDDGVVSGERTLVGCVATAAEQVLSYYDYPSCLQDSIAGFSTSNNGTIATIPKGEVLDFDNILNVYVQGEYSPLQADAVAKLSYYLGVACEMDWGVGSSGASMADLAEPLHRAFGYRYVRYLQSYKYSVRQWFRLLMNELNNARPIVYAGYVSSGGGHAFVVDGMDDRGFFHINWGYGGNYDGYFDLSVLMPQESALHPTVEGAVGGLNHLQSALFLYPDSVAYEVGDTLTDKHRVEVGSVSFNRSPDTNMYIIADIKVQNMSDDHVYCPVQLFTYTKLDSLGYPDDIDYLGVAEGDLEAGCDTTLQAYITFRDWGTRFLGINTIDSLYLAFDTLDIVRAYQPGLNYVLVDSVVVDDSASFLLSIENTSAAYWSGRMVTYSLFEGPFTEAEGDTRHFTVLNLAPRGKTSDIVSFADLKSATDYTFVVRNPWNPVMQVPFTTSTPTAIDANEYIDVNKMGEWRPYYRLNERILIEYNESTGHYRQILSPR